MTENQLEQAAWAGSPAPVATANIDHNTLARLVQTNAVRATHIVGKPGGWGVIVKHAALVHDRWFREQVAQAIQQADAPATAWVSNDTVMAESAKRRAAWRSRAASNRCLPYQGDPAHRDPPSASWLAAWPLKSA